MKFIYSFYFKIVYNRKIYMNLTLYLLFPPSFSYSSIKKNKRGSSSL